MLVSEKEQSARKIEFSDGANFFLGSNDCGKSFVMKSIYYSLGADPQVHPRWRDAAVVTLVTFSVGGDSYSLLRNGRQFSLFDSNDQCLWVVEGITAGLTPKLGELFDFELRLSESRTGKQILATPAFQYLPFYIDQDRGWTGIWNSFLGLGQFQRWKQEVKNYHSGLKPARYYVLKQKETELVKRIDVLQAELTGVLSTRERFSEDRAEAYFDIDPEDFLARLDGSIADLEAIQNKEQWVKRKLLDIRNKKRGISTQKDVADAVAREVNKDLAFLESLDSVCVECPTCGEEYENGFAERFGFVDDIEQARDISEQLSAELVALSEEEGQVEKELGGVSEAVARMKERLAVEREGMTLHEFIRAQGEKEVDLLFMQREKTIKDMLRELEADRSEIAKELKAITDRDRQAEVYKYFNEAMSSNLEYLQVTTLHEKDYKNISTSISETGSDLPRAVLAFTYAFLSVVKQFGNSTFMPIVIDSVNQQEQDSKNLRRMIDFIVEKRPEGAQLIVGSVDFLGREELGEVEQFVKPYSALEHGSYSELSESINYFKEQAYVLKQSEA